MSLAAPEYVGLAREQFARKLLGQQVTDYAMELLGADGSRVPVEISRVRMPPDAGGIPIGSSVLPIPKTFALRRYRAVLRKLGAHSRLEAVANARKLGLLP
jgi:hypothetical protein